MHTRHTHTFTHTFIHTNTHSHKHTFTHTHTHIHTHTHTKMCMWNPRVLFRCRPRTLSGFAGNQGLPVFKHKRNMAGYLVYQGSLRDTFCNHLKQGFFNTKIKLETIYWDPPGRFRGILRRSERGIAGPQSADSVDGRLVCSLRFRPCNSLADRIFGP